MDRHGLIVGLILFAVLVFLVGSLAYILRGRQESYNYIITTLEDYIAEHEACEDLVCPHEAHVIEHECYYRVDDVTLKHATTLTKGTSP